MEKLLFLSRADVESVKLEMRTVIALLEKVFEEKGHLRVEMPPKIGIHPFQESFIHAMPAAIPAMNAAGIKWIGGYPHNKTKGFPYITGLLILNDPKTGIPISVMDCTWITAMRTGAATALSAKYLARPTSSIVGILACGVQGRSNLEALACLYNLKKVYAYDVNPDTLNTFVREMTTKLGVEIVSVPEPKAAIVGSDIIVTSGPIKRDPVPTIEKDWMPVGAFASAVDFDSYWSVPALMQLDVFATDDLQQFEYYRSLGYFSDAPIPSVDLGELVIKKKEGRRSENDRTLAMNLGLAIDDLAIAPEIFRRALEKGIGTWVSL